MARKVVILCGPPGAGKTTAAHQSGLKVYDRDDPQWINEKQFTTELAKLATDPQARAVVIRAGASKTARDRAAKLVGATHIFVVLADAAECRRRVRSRHRADHVRGQASVATWFNRYEPQGAVLFPGWPAVVDAELSLGQRSQEW